MTTTPIRQVSVPEISVAQVRENHRAELEALSRYRRVTNYLAAAQIYLKDNVLLREPLKPEHIKERLLGHWGTCPGINLVYAHLNRLIRRYDIDMFLITGPGHGAPANLANLYLEGSLQEFYPELTFDQAGLYNFIKRFSWPGGFPSHLYPGIPGTIHEGGELGYALATSFGAVMDNPDLVVACIVGDGEAETGPTATAWHSYKFIDPAKSGAVLPILHLNGYKISSPTIYGTMSDEELLHLFTGYGYQVRIVEEEDLEADIYASMDWAYQEICRIQQAARSGERILQPRWPMLILRSLKGWTGIKEMHGVPIEGSFRSHQVPAKNVRSDPNELRLLEEWLRSYHVEELFTENGQPINEILEQCPKGDRRMGCNPHTFGGRLRKPLDLPSIFDYQVLVEREETPEVCTRGGNNVGNTESLAKYLRGVVEHNPHNFRIFSPDELESNKLTEVLEATQRTYEWPISPYDEHIGPEGGQVLEILSEHTCQAWLQGYILTGRHGMFPSYEAFLGIITTMMDQYAKFIKFSEEISWRPPVSSLNYLESSTLWRQEHNGFSHQNPSFINSVLGQEAEFARVYLPPDANCLISTMNHCLKSTGYVNLVIANKNPMPQWLSMEEAIAHCRAGASVWQWASTDNGVNPDVVLVGIGDVPTVEVLAAAHILRTEMPELRVRVVNVTDLMILEEDSEHPHGLDQEIFEALFTKDKPAIINFHGYTSIIKQLIYGRPNLHRFHLNGYREEGNTTTSFDMQVRNGTSRYHLIMQAIRQAAAYNPYVAARANERIHHYEYILVDHGRYIREHGEDPPEISNWQWC
ncbi:MAG: phosphoketolase family protein [Kastovskya adunca ATA6-11-RM4]|jgi:xylulose-5-phosphate/fructose-6-phosphate phosphoketolase|nr:phosphoketolase family protein [Kastovskya adunca ATA6-11-RM4]